MQAVIENNKQDMKSEMKSNKQDYDEKMIQFKSEMTANKQDYDEKWCNSQKSSKFWQNS